MEFISSRPDIVRSSNQRWLLDHWRGLRDRAGLPSWRGVAQGFLRQPTDLSLTEVFDESDGLRFRILFHGSRIAELYGRASCEGKFLDEILPASYSENALATYRQTVTSLLPVYTIADMRDAGGRIVHYERLLLPFSEDQVNVNRILASLETVSPEGAFDNHGLMKSPAKAPAFALCAMIQH